MTRVLALVAALLALATAGEAQAQSAISIEGNTTTVSEGNCSVTWVWPWPYGNQWVAVPSPECFAAPPLVEPVQASAPSGPGLDGLYGILQHFFPEQPAKAYRVVGCETGYTYSTAATAGPFRYDGRIVWYIGLFQVDPGIHGPVPKDAWGQVAQGRAIYEKAGGWSPWPVCGQR